MIHSSNMTHEEFYRVNGTLTPERIDSLLDEKGTLEAFDVREYVPCAQEAKGCFIGEDFMQEHLDDLKDIAKRLRGDNRNSLLMLIDRMESTIQEACQSAEYGASELDKIIHQS